MEEKNYLYLGLGIFLLFLVIFLGVFVYLKIGYFQKPQAIPEKWSQIPDSEIHKLSLQELRAKLDRKENLILVDLRSPQEYYTSHIKEAISIPYSQTCNQFDNFLPLLLKEKEVIFYCRGKNCGTSKVATKKMLASEYKNVQIFEGSVEEWQANGGAISTGLKP